jgi:hypothetical protein
MSAGDDAVFVARGAAEAAPNTAIARQIILIADHARRKMGGLASIAHTEVPRHDLQGGPLTFDSGHDNEPLANLMRYEASKRSLTSERGFKHCHS